VCCLRPAREVAAALPHAFVEPLPLPAFAGALDRVLEMFSDLRQFDQAKQWAEQFAAQRGDSAAVVDLISRQAEWSEQSSDYEAAAEMFVKARKWVARAGEPASCRPSGSLAEAAGPAGLLLSDRLPAFESSRARQLSAPAAPAGTTAPPPSTARAAGGTSWPRWRGSWTRARRASSGCCSSARASCRPPGSTLWPRRRC
jgi:hypothetical protein